MKHEFVSRSGRTSIVVDIDIERGKATIHAKQDGHQVLSFDVGAEQAPIDNPSPEFKPRDHRGLIPRNVPR